MRYTTLQQLADRVRTQAERRRVVAVVEADDAHALEAVRKAAQDGLVTPLLFGDRDRVTETLRGMDENPAQYDIVHTTTPQQAAVAAGQATREGAADFILKGHIQTGALLKGLFSEEAGFRVGNHISHMNLVQIPTYHKLFCLTDAAINIAPDLEAKKHMLRNAVATMVRMGIDTPKVAVLASSETVNPKMPETVDAAELAAMNSRGEITDCIVEGPLSYDLAMSKESAALKGMEGQVPGDADLLLCPSIAAANVLIKALRYSALAETAGIAVGGRTPLVLTSRAAEARDKYWTLVLAASATL